MTAERIDYATGEVVAVMTEPEARRATERIRTALDRVSTAWQDLAERVADAYARRADLALGYGSWAEYSQAEFNVPTLATEVRRELVSLLSAQGMSTRAIAPVVGVTRQAVSKALHQVATELPPEPQDQRVGTMPPASFTVETQETGVAAPPAPRPAVTGLDGKTYSRPEPTTPRRRSIVDAAQDAAADLLRAVEKVERIFADDRYPKNREQVAEVTNGYLSRSAELLGQLIDSGKE